MKTFDFRISLWRINFKDQPPYSISLWHSPCISQFFASKTFSVFDCIFLRADFSRIGHPQDISCVCACYKVCLHVLVLVWLRCTEHKLILQNAWQWSTTLPRLINIRSWTTREWEPCRGRTVAGLFFLGCLSHCTIFKLYNKFLHCQNRQAIHSLSNNVVWFCLSPQEMVQTTVHILVRSRPFYSWCVS